ncbi:MAG: hypothetical protein IPF63_03975 [Bacteroidetes bacterium]|nr:hypothetical protein [Bacteroidota bacterium]
MLKGETSKYNISASLITENNKLADQPEGFKHEKIHFVLDNKSETMGSIDLLNENQKVLASLEKAELIESGCFLTTACVGALGKKDDCYELQTLRAFRDTILKKNNKGLNLINEYYKIAPKIVNQINSSSENKVEYKNIYNKMILPTIDAIENKENQKAIDIYSEYFLFLKDTYLDNKISN